MRLKPTYRLRQKQGVAHFCTKVFEEAATVLHEHITFVFEFEFLF
jgi:hypothetical protein